MTEKRKTATIYDFKRLMKRGRRKKVINVLSNILVIVGTIILLSLLTKKSRLST